MAGLDPLEYPQFPIDGGSRPVWQPTYDDLADHVSKYIRDEYSRVTREFTDTTIITRDEAARAILDATDEVHGYVGAIPDNALSVARQTAAIGAAANALRDIDRDAARAFTEEYERRLKALSDMIWRMSRRGPDGMLKPPKPARPKGTFPPPYQGAKHLRF